MKVLVFPRDRNPYQQELYAAASGELVVRYVGSLTRSHTLNILLLPLECCIFWFFGYRAIHVHWVYPFALPHSVGRPIYQRASEMWYSLWLAVLSCLGMRLVWTAHNVLPHSPVFADDARARRSLLKHASGLIVHNEATLRALGDVGELPANLQVAELPACRSLLPVSSCLEHSGPLRWLYFGMISKYKGVDDLLRAVVGLNVPIHLVVVGECRDDPLRAEIEHLAMAVATVRLTLEFVSDSTLVSLIDSSDVVVLPFRAVTSSSSLLMAMGRSRAVVVPNLESFDEIPSDALLRYGTTMKHGMDLKSLIVNVNELPRSELAKVGSEARKYADSGTWTELARVTSAVLREAVEDASA